VVAQSETEQGEGAAKGPKDYSSSAGHSRRCIQSVEQEGDPMSEEFKPRLEYTTYAREPLRSLYAIERYLHDSGMDIRLEHVLKLRVSQINGCAYCIDMHWKDAKAAGETEQRLYGLNAWRESQYYSEKERAALEWAESVTLVSETHVPDDVYNRVRSQYSEKEIVDLTLAVGMINLWNRVAISFRAEPGKYQPKQTSAAAS
jgi:AhpD family alkylhydroperoxidase